jgi:hypothetical protein
MLVSQTRRAAYAPVGWHTAFSNSACLERVMLGFRSLVLFLVALLFAFFLLGATSDSGSACEPSGDYWFLETLTLENHNVPEIVQIEIVKSDDDRSHIHFEVATDAPLYVISQDTVRGLFPKDAVINQETWPDQLINHATFIITTESFPNGLYLSFEEIVSLDAQLDDYRRYEYSPPPENIEIPNTDRSALYLVYGEKVYEIPVEISYQLNDNYRDDCAEWGNSEMTRIAKTQATQTAIAGAQLKKQNTVTGTVVIILCAIAILGCAILLRKR